MIGYVYGLIKTVVLTIVVLLVSQIQINGKRICDHVGEITKSSAVQKPIYFLSDHLDFSEGKVKGLKQSANRTHQSP